MASMNWLGFSLSAQELPPPSSENPQHHQNSYNSGEISNGHDVSAGECYDQTPFNILEAFNRNNNNHHSQDWNMKSLPMSSSETNYKTNSSSDFSMPTTNQILDNHHHHHHHHHHQQPKLENFLGRHSFSDHDQNNHQAYEYMYPPPSTCTSLHVPSDVSENASSNIGLSMIKTWLRNQPPSNNNQNVPESKSDVIQVAATGALSLSMSTGSQSSTALPLLSAGESSSSENKQRPREVEVAATGAVEAVPRKSVDTFGQRTSIYRGVTRHRWTGRYEAHLWDNSCRREGQTRKGRQVYLGGYDKEEKAARAYDLAALKYWGTTTTTNFPISNYEKEIEEMKHMTRQEYVASLRRKSSGFSRGASIYRGVTRHHQHGRWQARIGRVAGNKDLYLGTFSTQEEAAEAYDIAAIKFRGLNAVTNFDMSRYDVKSILESSTLPIGGAAKRLKDAEAAQAAEQLAAAAAIDDSMTSSQLTDALSTAYRGSGPAWPTLAFNQPNAATSFAMHYPNYGANNSSRVWCKQEVQDDHHNQTFQYHDLNQQLQINNTQNFFQQPSSILHNLMGIDQNSSGSNLEHSSGSNSVMYGDGYGIPMATVIATDQHGSTNTSTDNHDHGFVTSSADMAYHRSLYNYMSQQPQMGSACNSWVPTAVPAISGTGTAPRTSGLAVTPTFTVWNDA